MILECVGFRSLVAPRLTCRVEEFGYEESVILGITSSNESSDTT